MVSPILPSKRKTEAEDNAENINIVVQALFYLYYRYAYKILFIYFEIQEPFQNEIYVCLFYYNTKMVVSNATSNAMAKMRQN